MFKTPTFEEIREAILRDTKSIWPSADVSEDSDHFVHTSRLASCASGQYAHQHWIARQIFPDTADSDYLERHAAMRGIYRRNPTTTTGKAVLTGIAGSRIAAGMQIRAGNRMYQVRFAGEIGASGIGRVRITALEAGAAANTREKAAEMMAAPVGVSSDCTVSAQGGTDGETDVSLLARLLEILRRPPAGGNKYDYRNWTLSVDGVTAAYVHPLRRGLGTVDVVITSENGLPSDETVKKVQDYVEDALPADLKNKASRGVKLNGQPHTITMTLHGGQSCLSLRRFMFNTIDFSKAWFIGEEMGQDVFHLCDGSEGNRIIHGGNIRTRAYLKYGYVRGADLDKMLFRPIDGWTKEHPHIGTGLAEKGTAEAGLNSTTYPIVDNACYLNNSLITEHITQFPGFNKDKIFDLIRSESGERYLSAGGHFDENGESANPPANSDGAAQSQPAANRFANLKRSISFFGDSTNARIGEHAIKVAKDDNIPVINNA